MTEERSLDDLGPVDYLIVEFPAGAQNFTGEGADGFCISTTPGSSGSWTSSSSSRMRTVLSTRRSCPTSPSRRAPPDRGPARPDTGRGRCREPGRRDGSRQCRRRPRLRERVGCSVRIGHAPRGWSADRQRADPDPGHHRCRRSDAGSPSTGSLRCRSVQDVEEVGVIGAPVAKAAVVGAAASARAHRRSPRPPSSAPLCRPGHRPSPRQRSSGQS